jgi:hypothetical protein
MKCALCAFEKTLIKYWNIQIPFFYCCTVRVVIIAAFIPTHAHIQGVPRVKVTTSGECFLC